MIVHTCCSSFSQSPWFFRQFQWLSHGNFYHCISAEVCKGLDTMEIRFKSRALVQQISKAFIGLLTHITWNSPSTKTIHKRYLVCPWQQTEFREYCPFPFLILINFRNFWFQLETFLTAHYLYMTSAEGYTEA